ETSASDFDLNMIESQLESTPGTLSGIALDLDTLRRHHRQVLQELPIGVCSVDKEGVVVLWNLAMSDITGLAASDSVGLPLEALPEPWRTLLGEFLERGDASSQRHVTQIEGRERHFNLHKAITQRMVAGALPTNSRESSRVILLEDLTETSMLEAELAHAERLSSIGRLAAGVAHEIGNP